MAEGSSEGGPRGLRDLIKRAGDYLGLTKESKAKDEAHSARVQTHAEDMEARGSSRRLVIPKDPAKEMLDIKLEDPSKKRDKPPVVISTTPPNLDEKRVEKHRESGGAIDPLIAGTEIRQAPPPPGAGLDNNVLNQVRPKETISRSDPTPPNPDRPTPSGNPKDPDNPAA